MAILVGRKNMLKFLLTEQNLVRYVKVAVLIAWVLGKGEWSLMLLLKLATTLSG